MANTKPIKQQSISKVPDEVDLNMYIPVINGFHGMLVYKSSRTNEEFHWDAFGDVQDLELRELRNAKSTAKGFFEKNYFLFDDDHSWVIEYLGLNRFYDHSLSAEGFDEIFSKSASEIKSVVSKMPAGQKKSLMYCAKEKIASGEIDSFRTIRALEEGLGVKLTDTE